MMLFILVESILIAGITLYQFNKQNSEYHEGRLERKESNLLIDIKYEIEKNSINSLVSLSDQIILEMADVHNIEFELYSLDGLLIKSSTALTGVRDGTVLDPSIIEYFNNQDPPRYIENDENTTYFKSSYNLVSAYNDKPLGIIYLSLIHI